MALCAAGCPSAIQLMAGPEVWGTTGGYAPLFARHSAAAACGQGQSALPTHVDVDAMVNGSVPEKGDPFSSIAGLQADLMMVHFPL